MKSILAVLLLAAFVVACGGSSPEPTNPPPAPTDAVIVLPTSNSFATETAITERVLATLTASAPQSAPPDAGAATVTPPALPAATSGPTLPPPTLSVALSPSVTPVPVRATNPPPAVPTAVPTEAPTAITRDSLRGKILFKTARNDGNYPNRFDYYVMDADGQNQTRIPRDAGEALYQELKPLEGYSPDRSTVVLGEFACNGSRCDLYIGPLEVVQARSQGVWTPSQPGNAATDPVWSPDGSRIAFMWTRDNQRTKNVFVAPPESNPQFLRLTNFGGKRDSKHPSFSPDSAQIVFATQDGPRWQIWVVDSYAERDCQEENCTTNPRNLSNTETNEWDPLWIK